MLPNFGAHDEAMARMAAKLKGGAGFHAAVGHLLIGGFVHPEQLDGLATHRGSAVTFESIEQ